MTNCDKWLLLGLCEGGVDSDMSKWEVIFIFYFYLVFSTTNNLYKNNSKQHEHIGYRTGIEHNACKSKTLIVTTILWYIIKMFDIDTIFLINI